MSDPAIAFPELVGAWISAERFATAHPDLADYHEKRYAAISAAFGVDLRTVPEPAPSPPAWMYAQIERRRASHVGELRWRREESWARDVHRFLGSTQQHLRQIHGPFSGYITIDVTLQAARWEFSSPITEAITEAQAQWRRMIVELFAALFPAAAAKTVDREQLLQHGFDDSRPGPDADDYW